MKNALRLVLRFDVETLVELLDTSARVDHLLLTRVEGVALRANVDTHFGYIIRRTGNKGLAAVARNLNFMIIRMDIILHNRYLSNNVAELLYTTLQI